MPGDRPAALGELRYPVIVKAATKPSGYGLRFRKAYIAESPRAAAGHAAMLADATGQAVVQEWISGGDDRIFFCLQYVGASGPVASFVGQKLASWPPMYGGTAICTAAPERYRSELSDLTTEFFVRAGFQGMGSMEFKVDDRDGTAYMIEPTVGRTDFQEEVATVNGVNLPLAAWTYEVGRPVPEARYRSTPRLWADSVHALTAQPTEKLRALARRLTAVDATWRWYDPMPFLGREADRIRSGLRRSVRSLTTDV
jgi:predicted ATP-grasp superfamily ATP-dependent carboligase